MPPHSECREGAIIFVEQYFHDCIYNVRDLVAFSLGIFSISCWLFAQAPQLYENYKNKNADALSPWFLASWLLGDTCNLMGCLMAGNQVATVVLTAMYFICMDAVMMVQYIFYHVLRTRELRRYERVYEPPHRQPPHHRPHGHHHPRAAAPNESQSEADQSSGGLGVAEEGEIAASLNHRGTGLPKPATRALACVALLVIVNVAWWPSDAGDWSVNGVETVLGSARRLAGIVGRDLLLSKKRPKWLSISGLVLGYASSFFYLAARASQIYLNWQRKTAEGLASAMFAFAITANVSQGLSILLRTYTWPELFSSLPWVLGTLGTVALDIVIISQALVYRPKKRKNSGEGEALLEGEPLPGDV